MTGKVTLEADEIRAQLADANTADDTFLRMLESVGGFERYNHLLDTLTHEELGALYERYGVEHPDNPPRTDIGRAK